jgi:hypothetical protein
LFARTGLVRLRLAALLGTGLLARADDTSAAGFVGLSSVPSGAPANGVDPNGAPNGGSPSGRVTPTPGGDGALARRVGLGFATFFAAWRVLLDLAAGVGAAVRLAAVGLLSFGGGSAGRASGSALRASGRTGSMTGAAGGVSGSVGRAVCGSTFGGAGSADWSVGQRDSTLLLGCAASVFGDGACP